MKKNKPTFREGIKKAIPPICNVFGTLILLLVIAMAVPLSIPRMFGYEIYNVLSPSMSPEIPMGSIVYVEEVVAEDVQVDDVIVFTSLNDTVTHRVVENRFVEGEFITKGDANASVDAAVPYGALVGRVTFHIPYFGEVSRIYSSTVGKIYMIGFAVIGVLFNLLASRLRDHNSEDEEEKTA